MRGLSALNVLCLVIFLGQIQNYMMRLNLSILIVAMVNHEGGGNVTEGADDAQLDSRFANRTQVIVDEGGLPADAAPSSPKYDWDPFTQGLLLSAFSYGYLSTQIVGGRLAEKFGFRRVYGLSLLGTALLTFASPMVIKLGGVYAFFVLRILQGVFEGPTFPSLNMALVCWVPIEQRGRFVSRSFLGTVFGLVLTFPLCGYLADEFGWEWAYYVIGLLTLAWFLCWCHFVYDSPKEHPRISSQEKARLIQGLSVTAHRRKPSSIPWLSIVTSLPCLAFFMADLGNIVALITLNVNGPAYFKYMLQMDLKTNGLLSALPMLCRFLGSVTFGQLADWLYQRNLSLLNVRRLFNTLSSWIPCLLMIVFSFSGTNVPRAMMLLCVTFFFNGACTSGHFLSPTDLSPNFAGTIFGLSNTLTGGGMGFVVPTIIGAITQDNMTFGAWRLIFCLAAGMYFMGNLLYVIFIRAETQPWDSDPSEGAAKAEAGTGAGDEGEEESEATTFTATA